MSRKEAVFNVLNEWWDLAWDPFEKMWPELETALDTLDEGWTRDEDIEGGQPNGIGTIESNDTREWYHEGRESHHRTVYTIYGPWEDGPTPEVQKRRDATAAHIARITAEARAVAEANRESDEDKVLAQAEEIRQRRLRAAAE